MDAVHTGEIDMATAEDVATLARANQEQRIVITLDSDFHTLLALSSAAAPSVIRIRIEGLRAEELTSLRRVLINKWADELVDGVAPSIQRGCVRMNRLPLL